MTTQKADKAPSVSALVFLPLPKLSEALQDSVAPKLRISLASVALDKMIERTNHKSKRAVADHAAAMRLLKQYEEQGGKL